MSRKKLIKVLRRKLIGDDEFISSLRKAIASSEKKKKKKEAQSSPDPQTAAVHEGARS